MERCAGGMSLCVDCADAIVSATSSRAAVRIPLILQGTLCWMRGRFLAMSFSGAHHDDGHRGRLGAGFVLDRDSEGFRLGVWRKRRIDDGCGAVGVGLED